MMFYMWRLVSRAHGAIVAHYAVGVIVKGVGPCHLE